VVVELDDVRISRQHAEIDCDEEGRLFVSDLRSRNGTFVNGRRVRGKTYVQEQDILRIGTTELTVSRGHAGEATARGIVAPGFVFEDRAIRGVSYDALITGFEELSEQVAQGGMPDLKKLDLCYQLGEHIAGLHTIPDLVDAITDLVAKAFGADHTAVFASDRTRLCRMTGQPDGPAEALRPPSVPQLFIQRSQRLREAVLYDARRLAAEGEEVELVSASLLTVQSAIAVPLCVGDHFMGVLYADTQRIGHFFDLRTIGRATLVGLQAAKALEAARRHNAALEAQRELTKVSGRLRVWNTEVERKLHQRSDEIDQQKVEITELLENKEDLLRMAAHDLRAPLASIVGYGQIAENDLDAGDLDAVRASLETVIATGRRLARFVDDLLTADSIRTGHLEVRRRDTDISDVIKHTVTTVAVQALERNVAVTRFVAPGVDVVYVDPDRINQVLDNLANNAVKALGRGGHVEIRAEREDDALVLSVEDNGPGLGASQRRRLMRVLGREVEAAAHVIAGAVSSNGGFGLGLVIASKLAQLMGATLRFHSTGKGTTIVLHVPGAFRDSGYADDSARVLSA
jgi:signal transduction histidine kinase